MRITDFDQLCKLYYEAVSIRSNTPISFQILISKLGLFDSDSIISNEELEIMENFRTKLHMQISAKELAVGA